MKNVKEISVEQQQTIYGAWGGNDETVVDGGWLDGVVIIGNSNNTGYDSSTGWDVYEDGYDDYNSNNWGGINHGGSGSSGDDSSTQGPITLENVPDMEEQAGNMCTLESIRFIAEFEGLSLTLESIITFVAQTFGYDAVDNGLSYSQLVQLADNYFTESNNLTNTSQISTAIDNGNMVLGILLTSPTDGHAIVITGYNSTTGQYQYADPQTGQEGLWVNSSEIDSAMEIGN